MSAAPESQAQSKNATKFATDGRADPDRLIEELRGVKLRPGSALN